MNTKTMRLPPRRVSMPNNKRKERDDFDPKRLNPSLTKQLPKPTGSSAGSDKAASALPAPSNHLLAGYLAHEFLTCGTLFGKTWDPTRPQQMVEPGGEIGDANMDSKERFRSAKAEPKPEPREEVKRQRSDYNMDPKERSKSIEAEPEPKPKPREEEKRKRYAEVACLLKADGAHIQGIVNPSQLGRFLEM